MEESLTGVQISLILLKLSSAFYQISEKYFIVTYWKLFSSEQKFANTQASQVFLPHHLHSIFYYKLICGISRKIHTEKPYRSRLYS